MRAAPGWGKPCACFPFVPQFSPVTYHGSYHGSCFTGEETEAGWRRTACLWARSLVRPGSQNILWRLQLPSRFNGHFVQPELPH